MAISMKAKLIHFPAVPKDKRLAERAKIIAENFRDYEHGIPLMIYLTRKMYEVISASETDWCESQILAKLHELEAYLHLYEAQIEENDKG